MTWMATKLSDAERVAQAVEIGPGRVASPWERGTCPNGRAYKTRWTWRPDRGETIEHGEPDGLCGCRRCCPARRVD